MTSPHASPRQPDNGDRPSISGLRPRVTPITPFLSARPSSGTGEERLASRTELEALKRVLAERDRALTDLWQQLEVALSDVAHLYRLRERAESASAPPGAASPETSTTNAVPSETAAWTHYPVLQRVSLRPTGRPPSDSAEQRRDDRRDVQVEVEFTDDTHFYAGLTRDVSRGGLFIATYHQVDVGTSLALSFELPDGTPVEARGEVCWVREPRDGSARPGLGVAFTELSESDARKIRAFCESRPPLYVEL